MRYAVAILDLFEGGLNISIVEAPSWRLALELIDRDKSSFLPMQGCIDNLKDTAIDQDWYFDVKEVP